MPTDLPPEDDRSPWAAPPDRAHGAPGYAASFDPSTVALGQSQPPGPWTAAFVPPPPRSLRGLGRATAALLAAQVVLGVVGALVSAWGVLSWSRVSSAPPDLVLAPDRAELFLLLARAPLAGLTAIAFIGWVWVATANLRNAGVRVRHAPGWALGGWLVPILNLWRPKQMVDDLWRGSMPGVPPGVDLKYVRKPVGVTAWWAAYLIGSALPAIGVMKTVSAALQPYLQAMLDGTSTVPYVDTARLHETTAMWNMWGAVLMTVAAGCAVAFVLRISRWQDEQRAATVQAYVSKPVAHASGSW